MIQIINNEIIQIGLPKSGKLSDGTSVSGYHLLDSETLKAEGWLPIEDVKPEYDAESKILVHSGWDIQADKVVKLYEIVNKPVDRLTELEETLEILLDDGNEE